MINLPEGWAIKSEDLVSKTHGDLGYELDYSLCYTESTDFTMQIPENIKRVAKAGYVWLNKLTGYRLQKGMDGRWRVVDRPKKQKDRIYTKKAPQQQPEEENTKDQLDRPIEQKQEPETPPPQKETEQQQPTTPTPAPAPAPSTSPKSEDDYSSLVQRIKSSKNLNQYVKDILRERNDALEWIDRERNRDRRTPEDIDKYDEKTKKDFDSRIEQLAAMFELDPDQIRGYMNREIKFFGLRGKVKSAAKGFINEWSKHLVNEYDSENADTSVPFDDDDDTKKQYEEIIEKNIRKLCEVNGKDPEKEIERVRKKIEERAKSRAEKEINVLRNSKEFKQNFSTAAEKRGFEVLTYPEDHSQPSDYTLSKEIGNNRLDFVIENIGYSPQISFTVNDSYGKVKGLNEREKAALALSTAKAFQILLRTYKDSDMIFRVEPYDGDGNGEYREEAYRNMGFGEVDEWGAMRGRIVNGKMIPVNDGEDVYQPEEEEDEDEEFAENNRDLFNAIYKVLFLENMK